MAGYYQRDTYAVWSIHIPLLYLHIHIHIIQYIHTPSVHMFVSFCFLYSLLDMEVCPRAIYMFSVCVLTHVYTHVDVYVYTYVYACACARVACTVHIANIYTEFAHTSPPVGPKQRP